MPKEVLTNAALLTTVVRPGGLQATSVQAPANAGAAGTHVYKVMEGHKIHADVYRAPGDDIRPVVMWIHGGALIFGTRKRVPSWQFERYMDAGFVIVSIDYRLGPELKLPAIVEDIEDAYRWIRAEGLRHFRIDPDRVAIVGHSGGGYLALVMGFRSNPPPRALVSFYGYGEITGSWYSRPDPFYNQMPAISKEEAFNAVGSSVISATPVDFVWPEGRSKFYVYCRQQGIWPEMIAGRKPEEESAWFGDYEPLRRVTESYPPTLLLHGEKDTDVPFEQSVLMVEALERHGVPNEFIGNPVWGHGFDQAEDDQAVQQALDRVIRFLDTFVK